MDRQITLAVKPTCSFIDTHHIKAYVQVKSETVYSFNLYAVLKKIMPAVLAIVVNAGSGDR